MVCQDCPGDSKGDVASRKSLSGFPLLLSNSTEVRPQPLGRAGQSVGGRYWCVVVISGPRPIGKNKYCGEE